MGMANVFFRHLKIAIAFAALSSTIFTSIGSAQTNQPAALGPFVVSLQTPASHARLGGNTTFTGAAVDCVTGAAATRVAVYDGIDRGGTYVGDAAMDTSRALSRYCTNQNQSATGQIGFTLITNSRQLRDGPHTIAFVADFPSGGSSTITVDVVVDNFAPRFDAYYDPLYGPAAYGNMGYYSNYGSGYGYSPYNTNYGYSPYNTNYGYSPYNTNYSYNSYYNGYYGGYSPSYSSGYLGGYLGGYNGLGGTAACGTSSYYAYLGCGGNTTQYSLTNCTAYNCGGGTYNNTGCVAGAYFARCPIYGYYAYPYANYGSLYSALPGYSTANCAYYYISYTGCTGAYTGTSYITLNQAGQSLRVAGPIILSGFASCSIGAVNTITLTDRTGNANNVVGSAITSGSTYSISWNPPPTVGTHVIQITAAGACGTFSQSFTVSVIP